MKRRRFLTTGTIFTLGLVGTDFFGEVLSRENLKLTNISKNSLNKYVLVSMFESPPRWNMDLILEGSDNPNKVDSPVICTEFNNLEKDKITTSYKTINYKGHKLPSIWQNQLITEKGSMEMLNILKNALIVKGCDMEQDGHVLNSMKLEAPVKDKISFSGALSEKNNLPFYAVGLTGIESDLGKNISSAFKNHAGGTPVEIRESQDYFDSLLESFYKDENAELKYDLTDENFFSQIRKGLGKKSKINIYREKISQMNELNLSDMKVEFLSKRKIYQKIITESLRNKKLKNISDRKIPGLELPKKFKLISKDHLDVDDYIGAYRLDDYYIGNPDMRTLFAKSIVKNMADQFALTEIGLKYDLTPVFLLNINPISDLDFKNSYLQEEIKSKVEGDYITIYSENKKTINGFVEEALLNTDAHNVGSYIGLLGYSILFNTVSSCLNELITSLKKIDTKKGSLFDDTLIHLTSEFDRIPQKNLAGSDHGWNGHTSSFFSGKIEGLQTLGEVTKDKNNLFWGQGAVLSQINRRMRYADIIKSMSSLFGIKSPIGGAVLFQLNDQGKIVVNKGSGTSY